MPGRHALFLDRDGVINHDSGYTSRQDNFQFIDGIFELCRAAKQAGYVLIVITNQAGIGRGYYSEQDFKLLTDWMRRRFDEEGAPIADVFHCPYHPTNGVGHYRRDSFDRKPNPGMLLKAQEKHGLALESSIMIGDKDSDMEAASNASVGVRCHFMADVVVGNRSKFATHEIHSLREGILLLCDAATE